MGSPLYRLDYKRVGIASGGVEQDERRARARLDKSYAPGARLDQARPGARNTQIAVVVFPGQVTRPSPAYDELPALIPDTPSAVA